LIAVNLLLGRLKKPDKKIDTSSDYSTIADKSSTNLRLFQVLAQALLLQGPGKDFIYPSIDSVRSDHAYNNYLSK